MARQIYEKILKKKRIFHDFIAIFIFLTTFAKNITNECYCSYCRTPQCRQIHFF